MTIRNLDALFEPKAIALVGASNQPGSVGAVLARNLTEAGFSGPILPVNPHEQSIGSILNYKDIASLPVTPDLAVIATPPATVPGLIAELGARGTRAAVVVTAGFGEGASRDGQRLRNAVLDAARPHLMRIVGPNCLGFISPGRGINASFAHLTPKPGGVAFVTQSGALATAVLDWAAGRHFGFSHLISVGDMADVDFGDLLDYLAVDPATTAILLYIESVGQARKFMSAARIAARAKPVVVIKSGSSGAGARAALSHTGALAGADLVYDAAFRRAGMLRVHELRELFESVATLSAGVRVSGDRLAILTNGGGAGVLAADALEGRSGHLAKLTDRTLAALDAELPPTWSHNNPVDILGDAHGDRYAAALKQMLVDPQADAILVLNCPTAVADSTEAASSVLKTLSASRPMPVFSCWLGDPAAVRARSLLTAAGVPTYETPDEAVRAFMHTVEYGRNQEALLQTPPARRRPIAAAGKKIVRNIIDRAIAEKRPLISEPEAKAILEAYGIPTATTRKAIDPAEAARVAEEIGFPVVLKILSPDISHKSDVGGVRLDLATAPAVEAAAAEMIARVRGRLPDAKIDGFVVEEMVKRPDAQELLLGLAEDPVFGPVILFGQGGTAAEVIRDRAIGLPPLNQPLALGLIARTRIASLLGGYRDRPPVDVEAVAGALIALSELVIDFPEIAELDINPLIADHQGAIALDARVVVRAAEPSSRMAIRPYPAEMEHKATLPSGQRYLIRPVRPEDEGSLIAMFQACSPDDLRMRFLGQVREFPHLMAARLTQIDYDREMALIAAKESSDADPSRIDGFARMVADPDGVAADFSIIVRSEATGHGIGYQLLTDLIVHARERGLRSLAGDVFQHNQAMLTLTKAFDFVTVDEDRDITRISLVL